MEKMNPSVKERWVKALRSGKYRQTRGKLKGQFGYCCLGVLCEVENEPIEEAVVMPTRAFRDRVGLDRNKADKLATLNDSSKRNFKWIADWIEKNL